MIKAIGGVWLAIGAAALASAGEVTVALIPKVTGNAFFEAANLGAQAHAKRVGFTVKYMGSPVASVENQEEIIGQAIRAKVAAICLSSVDASGLDEVMQEARQAGIATVTWDSDISPDARIVMVSQGTPEILGKMLVEMGADALANRGKRNDGAIRYAWHYSQMAVADQNSWQEEGEKYIKQKFPTWINVATSNYYSFQDPQKAIEVGESILKSQKNIDLIICNDSTALPGQLQAMKNLGKGKNDVTVTGFAPPNAIKAFCRDNVIERWGLWDCGVQAAIACHLGYIIATGHTLQVGSKISIPGIGEVEMLPNEVMDPLAPLGNDSGVVLLPERTVFTRENMDSYDF